MSADLYEILSFGRFSRPGARLRRWVEPGRGLPVSREDLLMVYVDRVNEHEQVVFSLHGPAVADRRPRQAVLAMRFPPLNFEVVARAVRRNARGRVRAVWVELINLQLAAQAS